MLRKAILTVPRQDYQIDANDQLVTSKDYQDVVVAYRNGAPVMLTDVAHIVDGVENQQPGRVDGPVLIPIHSCRQSY